MDPKAKQILIKAFWGSTGWKSGDVSDQDFAYCKQQGLMFEPRTLTHGALVSRTIKARDAVKLKDCGTAFVCSLSTRTLHWRSAIGSYGNCEVLKTHRFKPHSHESMSYLCDNCEALKQNEMEDLNAMSFERVKWGGVRHDKTIYNRMDLEQFAAEKVPKPTSKDIKILRGIIKAIQDSGPKDSKGKLKKRFKPLLAANSDELQVLVEILSIARVITHDGRGDQQYDAKRAKAIFGKWL